MNRRAFTLIEMLVATAVFVLGFAALYTMFLLGVRNRVQAEALTNTSLVADAVVAEMRLAAGTERAGSITPPALPSDYVGDGNAENGPEVFPVGSPDSYDVQNPFFAYPEQPGVFYRVMQVTGLVDSDGDGVPEDDDPTADALRVHLLVGQLGIPRDSTSIDELRRRYGLGATLSGQEVVEALVERHLLRPYDAVVLRRYPD